MKSIVIKWDRICVRRVLPKRVLLKIFKLVRKLSLQTKLEVSGQELVLLGQFLVFIWQNDLLLICW